MSTGKIEYQKALMGRLGEDFAVMLGLNGTVIKVNVHVPTQQVMHKMH